MTSPPRWVPLQALVDLHRQQIAEHGGLPGIPDPGRLEAALARANNLHGYHPRADLASLAAAQAVGIAQNHPFVDGNKRMALVAIYVFLGLNGLHLDAREEDAYLTMLALAEGGLSEEALAAWIRANAAPRPPTP